VNSLLVDEWNHVLVTYSGGITGSTVADVQDYYDTFNMYIDGVLNGSRNVLASNSNTLGGYSGSINTDKFRIGKMGETAGDVQFATGRLDQIAIWDNDQSANVSTIYNSGTAQDLTLLSEAPAHYYELGDSITSITDLVGSANLVPFSFVASDMVTDSPS